jgi:hypothetical protein
MWQTRSEHMLLGKNGAYRFAWRRVATNLQFAKKKKKKKKK